MADQKYLTVENLTQQEYGRIFSQISVDGTTGCWNWTGTTSKKGYGYVGFRGKKELAHRLMYAWKYGPIPRGYGTDVPQVDHYICNNRGCCNPEHLKIVTLRENSLRSSSPAAYNYRKVCCKNGHKLPEIPNKFGQRSCKICKKEYDKHRDQTEHVRKWQTLNPDKVRQYKLKYYNRIHGK